MSPTPAPTAGELATIAARTARQARTVAQYLADTLAALETCRNGYPAATLGPGGSHANYGGESTTTTERAALTPDVARNLERRLTSAMLAAELAIDQAAAIVTSWAPLAHPARPSGCRSCARNRQHYEPVTSRGLCSWCADFTLKYVEFLDVDELDLVPLPLLELHHTGRRLTSADLTRHLPGYQP